MKNRHGWTRRLKSSKREEKKKITNRIRKGLLKHDQFFRLWSVSWRKILSFSFKTDTKSIVLPVHSY